MNELIAALVIASLGAWLAFRATHALGGATNPTTLFISAWPVTLSLFALHLLPYPPLRGRTVAILASSLSAFVVGTLVSHLPGWRALAHRTGGWYRRRATTTERNVTVGVMILLLGSGAFATILYIRAVARIEGLFSFFTNLAAVRVLKPNLDYPASLFWGAAMFIWLLAATARTTPGGS